MTTLPDETGAGGAPASSSGDGSLSAVHVRGLVFTNDDIVPPEKRGTNDEDEFRALVSCLVSEKEHGKKISTVNITTAPFPATRSGDSDIDAQLQLPGDCVAPIIFIISGDEDHWFAVTGAETGG